MVRIVVKFMINTNVCLESAGRFTTSGNEDVTTLNTLLNQKRITSVYPLFTSVSNETPEDQKRELQRYIGIDLEDTEAAESLVRDLEQLPFVEQAYIEPPTELA